MDFRKLKANEIDCRVSTCSSKGVSLLLYKDARCDMNILDETVGSENWQRNHEVVNGNLFCNVGIKCDGEWVWKQDVGTESYTEKEKGQASDSFKRACFNWGIGRELYTAPFMWMSATKVAIEGNGTRYTTKDRFKVTKIEYEGNVISYLEVKVDKNGGATQSFGNNAVEDKEEKAIENSLNDLASEAQKKAIFAICKAHRVDITKLYEFHKVTEKTATKLDATRIIQSLKKKYGE